MPGVVANKVRRSRRLLPATAVLLGGLLMSACYGWSTQYTAGTNVAFLAMSCASTSDCVAVADVPNGDSPTAPTIETTTNGGSAWNAPSGGTDQNLESVSCPDATHCIAGGYDLVNGVGVGDVWVTTNPQGTWTLTSSVAGAGSVSAVSCANDSDCFALAYGDFSGGGQALIETVDGGEAWSFVFSTNTSRFASLACPSATTCFLAGQNEASDPEIMSTTNLDTWHTTALGGNAYLSDISCATTVSCMVVGTTAVFSTSHGSTWVNDTSALDTDTGSSLNSMTGVSCVDAADCTVVGSPASDIYGQSVAATNNGGTTWHVEALSTPPGLLAVSCVSTTTCWAASSTNIVATSNGGVASPQLNSLSPNSGPAGTTVTINGASLNSTPVSVDFGSVAATDVTVVSVSEVTAVAPAGTGTVDVTVHTALGASPYVIEDQFTYTG